MESKVLHRWAFHASRAFRWALVGSAAAAVAACTGQIGQDPTVDLTGGTGTTTGGSTTGGSTTTGGTGTTTGGSTTTGGGTTTGGMVDPMGKWQPPKCDDQQHAFAPSRVWQLTDLEYVNIVRDVLQIQLTGMDAEITAPASKSGEYNNLSQGGGTFTDNLALNYQTAALNVTKQAIVPAKMQTLMGNAATTPATDAQLTTFINNKVARLWRRPVTSSETSLLKNLYNSGTAAADGGPAHAFDMLLQAVLQSGSFLYRTELGNNPTPATTAFPITNYELATALSMMFLETGPDDTLWQKAGASMLTDPTVLAGEVDRLMNLPAAKDNMALKTGYWLWTERVLARPKDSTIFAAYTPTVQQSVFDSGRAFVKDVIASGTLWDLLTSKKVFVNKDITSFYGIPGGTGTTLVPVTATTPDRSAGIFTQPAFIAGVHKRAAITDPIHMGLFVFEQMLCGGDGGQDIPPPPADALDKAAKMMGTERELVAQRAALSCGACHGNFDTIGLTYQPYDATGRYSLTQQVMKDANGVAKMTPVSSIDTSGAIGATVGPDLKGPLTDVIALAQKLSTDGPNKRVAYCAGKKLAIFALGTDPNALNSCELQQVKEKFYSTGSFVDFYRSLATSPGFVTHNPG
jgi:hypothetical protein